MDAYEIIIRFIDGSKLILPNVTEYRWLSNESILRVAINNCWQMFNLNSVMYVGRTCDLGEEVVSA